MQWVDHIKKLRKSVSESEFGDDDRFGSVVDETFPAFIESIELVEHVSRSES